MAVSLDIQEQGVSADPARETFELRSHSELFEALAAAQLEFPPIIKDKTAKIRSERSGTSYEFQYAELAQIYDKVRPVLNRHGIALLQPTFEREGKTYVVTQLVHGASNQIFRSAGFPLPTQVRPEEMRGYQVRYQRYDLCGVLAISAEEDVENIAVEGAKPKRVRSEALAGSEQSQAAPPTISNEERNKWVEGIRAYRDVVGSEPLKKFILNYTGAKDLKSISTEGWAAATEALTVASQAGNDQLIAVVNADNPKV